MRISKLQQFLLWTLIVLCCFLQQTESATISTKNKNNTSTSSMKDKLQNLPRSSQTIIRPTNVFKDTGDLVEDDRKKDDWKWNLRLFEWLHKKLSEYLACAYTRRGGCEKKLSEALKVEGITDRLNELNKHDESSRTDDANKWNGGGPKFEFGKPHDRFVVMDSNPEASQEAKTNLLQEYGQFHSPNAPFEGEKFGPGDFEKPYNRGDFYERDPMPFVAPREMPYKKIFGGPDPLRGPVFYGRKPDVGPWNQPGMRKFRDSPHHFPFGMMGLPFMIPLH